MEELHDKVIAEIVQYLNKEKYDIYTNPAQEKNARIGEHYPDVIMGEKDTNTAKIRLGKVG